MCSAKPAWGYLDGYMVVVGWAQRLGEEGRMSGFQENGDLRHNEVAPLGDALEIDKQDLESERMPIMLAVALLNAGYDPEQVEAYRFWQDLDGRYQGQVRFKPEAEHVEITVTVRQSE